jgi:hypothetical protein
MTAKQDMETQSIQCHVQDIIVVIVIIRPTPRMNKGPEHNTEKNAEGNTRDNAEHNAQEYTELSLESSSRTMQEQSYSSHWAESI